MNRRIASAWPADVHSENTTPRSLVYWWWGSCALDLCSSGNGATPSRDSKSFARPSSGILFPFSSIRFFLFYQNLISLFWTFWSTDNHYAQKWNISFLPRFWAFWNWSRFLCCSPMAFRQRELSRVWDYLVAQRGVPVHAVQRVSYRFTWTYSSTKFMLFLCYYWTDKEIPWWNEKRDCH